MEVPEIIDIGVIEPGLKLPSISEKFDALRHGSSIIIHNDHDIKPLYYQLLAERGQTFMWKPVENGPLMWQVKIVKKSAQDNEETIGEIVARDYRKAVIFKNLGIDFSCGGQQTVAGACERQGLEVEEVSRQLAGATLPLTGPDMDFQSWDIGFMCKYMVQLHHLYIINNTPFIQELSRKISKSYGEKYPEIIEVAAIFEDAGKLLIQNMAKEEQSLFPYITALNEAYKSGAVINEAAFGPVSFLVYEIEAEHEKVAQDFRMLRTITKNYQLPPYVPPSYAILYKMLQEYEDDLHLHLHLENNILFAKAIQMENEMRDEKRIE